MHMGYSGFMSCLSYMGFKISVIFMNSIFLWILWALICPVSTTCESCGIHADSVNYIVV